MMSPRFGRHPKSQNVLLKATTPNGQNLASRRLAAKSISKHIPKYKQELHECYRQSTTCNGRNTSEHRAALRDGSGRTGYTIPLVCCSVAFDSRSGFVILGPIPSLQRFCKEFYLFLKRCYVADGGTGDVSPLKKTKVTTRKKLNFAAENALSTLDVWAKKFQTINRSSFQSA